MASLPSTQGGVSSQPIPVSFGCWPLPQHPTGSLQAPPGPARPQQLTQGQEPLQPWLKACVPESGSRKSPRSSVGSRRRLSPLCFAGTERPGWVTHKEVYSAPRHCRPAEGGKQRASHCRRRGHLCAGGCPRVPSLCPPTLKNSLAGDTRVNPFLGPCTPPVTSHRVLSTTS